MESRIGGISSVYFLIFICQMELAMDSYPFVLANSSHGSFHESSVIFKLAQ